MGIVLIPKNKQIEQVQYNYSSWDIVCALLKKECRQILTDNELLDIYFAGDIEIPEWKATEISLLLITLDYLSDKGTVYDTFHAFCRDSGGFKILWVQ